MSEVSSKEQDSQALVSVEEKQVEFYGDELAALRADDGQIYVAIRQMCLALGLDAQAQRRRMGRHAILSDGLRVVAMMATTTGERDAYVLRVDLVPLWLAGVDTKRVKEEIRGKLEHYQREAARVLWEAFSGRVVPADASPNAAALVQIRETALAIAELAQQQLEIDQRLTGRLDRAAAVVGELGKRVRALEAQLSPAGALTDGQAADIKNKVAGLARTLAEAGPPKDYYQSIYTELNRRFRSTSYKTIRQADYQAVLDFLDTWHESVRPKG